MTETGIPSSLMAKSRQSMPTTLRAPTRERVSEAIALVRARQAAEAQINKTNPTLNDISGSKVNETTTPRVSSGYDYEMPKSSQSNNGRLPLAPAGQTGSSEMKRHHQHSKQTTTTTTTTTTAQQPNNNSFLMSVFSSRSDVATSTTHDNEDSMPFASMSDEPEENIPEQTTSSRFMNPLELVKREIQLATQSSVNSRGPRVATKPDQRSTAVVSPSASTAISVDDSSEMAVDDQTRKEIGNFLDRLNVRAATSMGDESTESFEVPVDSKTIEEVNSFLYSLNIKDPEQIQSVLEQVASTESEFDPIGAMRSATSDDFIYGSNTDGDDESYQSSSGSVNPETIAEIGAYIDAVTKAPSTRYAVDPVLSATSWQSETNNSYPQTQDEDEGEGETEIILETGSYPQAQDEGDETDEIMQNESTESDSPIEQLRVSKPAPIYEQVEAKSLPRGAHKDPPAAITSHNADQVDPPANTANMNDAIMRMHESQAVAPSYSAESLESDNMMITDHHRKGMEEEEKKMDEDDTKNLSPVIEASSAETDGGEEKVDEAVGSKKALASMQTEVDQGNDDGTGFRKGLPPTPREQAGNANQEKNSLPTKLSSVQSTSEESTSSELVDDAGVPLRAQISSDGSDAEDGRASELLGRYDMIEADGSDDKNPPEENDDDASHCSDVVTDLPDTGLRNLPNSPSMQDDDSLPWDLKDIASEETMKAAGRTRPAALNPASRSKARKLISLLSDDSSVPQSELGMDQESAVAENDAEAESDAPKEHDAEAESDAPKEGFAFDDCVIEEGEEGVEVSETILKEEEEEETSSGDNISPNPSASEDRESIVDPSGPLGPKIDAEEEVAERRPDPDTEAGDEPELGEEIGLSDHLGPMPDSEEEVVEQGAELDIINVEDEPEFGGEGIGLSNHLESIEQGAELDIIFVDDEPEFSDEEIGLSDHLGPRIDSEEELAEQGAELDTDAEDESEFGGEEIGDDFVEAFLQQGSTSVDNADEYETGKESAEVSNDSKPSLQSHWHNPFASSPKEKTIEEEGLGFLEQFQSLEIDNEEESDRNTEKDGPAVDSVEVSSEAAVKTPRNLFTLAGIARFFAALDEKFTDDKGSMAQNVRFFQRLVAPVVAGEKPSIIEAAQIRQGAMRAEVPLEVVDRFLDLIDDQKENVQGVDHTEDLSEDETINAFLVRFGALKGGSHFPSNANGWLVEEYARADSADEAAEVDAEDGFGNQDLEIQESPDDDNDEDFEWWKGHQKDSPDHTIQKSESYESGVVDKIIGAGSDFEDNDEDQKEVTEVPETPTVAPSDASKTEPVQNLQTRKVPRLILNTRYSASANVGDEDDWARRNGMAHYGAGWEAHANWLSPRSSSNLRKPTQIDGVAAADNLRRFVFSKKIFKNHQPWRRLYRERTQFHPGFSEVDVNSIYDSTTVELVLQDEEEENYVPWERREVQQRFLQEKSYTFSRNWFGDLVRKRGNKKVKAPVCKPKSMEMPIENLPDQGEWTKEWFTQWKKPIERRAGRSRSRSGSYSTDGSSTDGGTYTDNGTVTDRGTFTDNGTVTDRGTFTDNGTVTDRGSFTEHGSVTDRGTFTTDNGSVTGRGTFTTDHGTTDHGYTDHGSYTDGSTSRHSDGYSFSGSSGSASTTSWEEAPECGEIINVKQKIGEKVSRVHPDFTSSLRRSRWRKKYFPRGTFPY